MKVTPSLACWDSIRGEFSKGGLLLGNGASIAVWPEFRYRSLFEKAEPDELDEPLTAADQRIFSAFETENFEEVLSRLGTAIIVAKTLGQDASLLESRYNSVRQALVQAVAKVHIEPVWVRDDG